MKRFESAVALLVFVGFWLVGAESVSAWGNLETHPAINEWAVKMFEKDLRPLDNRLANTRLNGGQCWGIAWDPQDGRTNTTQSIAVKRKKNLVKWIVDGGFSADEPEILMGLRHFYDPKNKTVPWLTDTHGVADWLEGHLTPERGIPEIDAVTWAIDQDDTGDDGAYGVQDWISISQDYSWFDAKKYYRAALADESRDNVNYGKAWRAVGEVMHMMADMAVPSHVRNDGHMWSEPLEANTDRSRVDACAGLTPAGSINYNTGVETLMRALALWTNENFFSQDTVPLPGKTTTANGMPAYPSPIPTKTTGTYEYRTVDGQSIILARIGTAGLLGRFWRGNNAAQMYQVDETAVLQSQQSILIPTAVRACAAVLNRFLPRFEISAEVSQSPDMAGTSSYSIHGEVTQVDSGTDWWNEKRLTIKNGVYLVVNGKATALPKRIVGDFNWFTHDFSAEENDQVWLRYDLGGYVVESAKIKIVGTAKPDVLVPNVVGMTQSAAENAIAQAGLLDSATTAYHDTVPAGRVVSQNPAAGTRVKPGSTVSIVVSLGPASGNGIPISGTFAPNPDGYFSDFILNYSVTGVVAKEVSDYVAQISARRTYKWEKYAVGLRIDPNIKQLRISGTASGSSLGGSSQYAGSIVVKVRFCSFPEEEITYPIEVNTSPPYAFNVSIPVPTGCTQATFSITTGMRWPNGFFRISVEGR